MVNMVQTLIPLFMLLVLQGAETMNKDKENEPVTVFSRCIFCQNQKSEDLRSLTVKGVDAAKDALECEEDVTAHRLLNQLQNVSSFLESNPKYHRSCRSNYTHKRRTECKRKIIECESDTLNETQNKRYKLDYKECCFLCEKKRDPRGKWELVVISTKERQNSIHDKAKELNDVNILTKIEGHGDTHIDMIARDFKYHRSCMTKFMNQKQVTGDHCFPSQTKVASEIYAEAFKELADEISDPLLKDKAIYELNELVHRYREILATKQIENSKYRKRKLVSLMEKYFSKNIQILNVGKKCIVCSSSITVGDMCQMVANLQNKLDESIQISDTDESSDEEEKHVPLQVSSDIFAIAKHTRKSVLEQQCCLKQEEPIDLELNMKTASSLIPNELYNLIASMITKEDSPELLSSGRIQVQSSINEQTLNICQDIMGNTTGIPMPKNVGLALYVLRQTRSKDIVTVLNRFGHAISYNDAQRYLTAAANSIELQTIEQGIFIPSSLKYGTFTHCAFDNLDFRENTRDGSTMHATSHNIYQQQTVHFEHETDQILTKSRSVSLCSARSFTLPDSNVSITMRRNARSLKNTSLEFLTEEHMSPAKMLQNETFIWSLMRQEIMSTEDLQEREVVSWNDFFEKQSNEKSKSTVAYGPLFPHSPTKQDTVQASIDYFTALSSKLGQESTVVTCDQAIYDIVKGIVHKQPERYKHLIVRLGGFHIAENFLGTIGTLMKGSGIEEILVQSGICLAGTANKVIGGKDYYKMVQYHSIISEAMSQILWNEFQSHSAEIDIDRDIMSNLVNLSEVLFSNTAEEIQQSLTTVKIHLNDLTQQWVDFCDQLSITGKYWLNYITMVLILKTYIWAERAGDWLCHLCQVKYMLPYMVAAGHTKYAKCIPHYLADMTHLETSHPDVFVHFINGEFTVHHSSGRFNGVWSDLALEQTFNREGKTSLLKGISQNDKAREKYIQTAPFLTKVSENVKTMAHVRLQASQHHRETTRSLKNDISLVVKIQGTIENEMMNPFATCICPDDLVNIATCENCPSTDLAFAQQKGIDAVKKANTSNADSIDNPKLQTFAQKSSLRATRNDITQIYKNESAVTRALWFLQNTDDQTRDEAFSHEWTEYPASLFKPSNSGKGYMMRKGNKSDFLSEILDKIENVAEQELPQFDLPSVYLIDFMAFVQKYQKTGAKSFVELASRYLAKIIQKSPYGCNTIHVVGDRYDFDNSESLKADERENRETPNKAREYIPSDCVEIPEWKVLMGNQNNKAHLSRYISETIVRHFSKVPDSKNIILGGTFEERHICMSVDNNGVNDVAELACTQHEEADTRLMAHLAYSVEKHGAKRAVIMCTDTDIIILAMYYFCRLQIDEIWIQKNDTYLPVHEIVHKVAIKYEMSPKTLSETLLTAYVFCGCDTTSYPFRKGKWLAARTGLSLVGSLNCISNFGLHDNDNSSDEHIVEARKYFVRLYGKQDFQSLDKLRQHIFANSNSDLRVLPPTEHAFYFHMLRCMYQLLIYHRAHLSEMNLPLATQYGRTLEKGKLVPIMSDIPSKPKSVKTVSCKCKRSKCL